MRQINFPRVPNWLQWLGAIATLTTAIAWVSEFLPDWLLKMAAGAIVGSASRAGTSLIWRKYFSDRWARRSREKAVLKAENIVVQFRVVREFREDIGRFQAASATVIADMVISIFVILIGASFLAAAYPLVGLSLLLSLPQIGFLIDFPHIEISNFWSALLAAMAAIAFYVGFLRMAHAWIKQETLIRPLTDWIAYYNQTLDRIQRLLAKAEMNDAQQAKFIDGIIEATEDQPDFLDEAEAEVS